RLPQGGVRRARRVEQLAALRGRGDIRRVMVRRLLASLVHPCPSSVSARTVGYASPETTRLAAPQLRALAVSSCAMSLSFDVSRVRASYPALRDGHAYLDGAAGTQVPVPVIDAIAAAYRDGIGNIGGAFAASERSGRIVAEARQAVADLVGGSAPGVVFGPS